MERELRAEEKNGRREAGGWRRGEVEVKCFGHD